jgi:RimJ/RimL family protein N-acetyltransferase
MIGATHVPALETERLLLRAHRAADLADCTAMWADPAVTRHIGGRAFSREETWGKIVRYAGLWSLLGYGYWAIEEKQTGRFVGELGFADFKRDIDPRFGEFPEIGWALLPAVHGRGYATEAVRAAVSWADAHIARPQTSCLITPDNVASIRVARKNDYREFGPLPYKGTPILLFRRASPAHDAAERPFAPERSARAPGRSPSDLRYPGE